MGKTGGKIILKGGRKKDVLGQKVSERGKETVVWHTY